MSTKLLLLVGTHLYMAFISHQRGTGGRERVGSVNTYNSRSLIHSKHDSLASQISNLRLFLAVSSSHMTLGFGLWVMSWAQLHAPVSNWFCKLLSYTLDNLDVALSNGTNKGLRKLCI